MTSDRTVSTTHINTKKLITETKDISRTTAES